MRRSHYRRQSKWPAWLNGRRRIVAAVATLVAFGAIITVTQVSNASTNKAQKTALAACDDVTAPKSSKLSTETKKGTYTTNKGQVTQHADDGAGDVPTTAQMRDRCRTWVLANTGDNASPSPSVSTPASTAATVPPGAGLGILTNNCSTSTLAPHTGFQDGDRCVSTEFGEVGTAANNPSLLITSAPTEVAPNTPFTLKVSTRNLIRDRFLAAGAGGYYVESSVLENGLVRGHFHTACRMLANTNEAPAPDPVPAFFVATEDSKGGAAPDVVTIQVPGLPTDGIAQCASWAGDGSHRVPMMQRANQTPAIDSVRIMVKGDAGNGGGDDNGGTGNGNTGGGATTPPTTAPTTAPASSAPPADNGNGNNGNGNTNGNGNSGNGGGGSATTSPTKATTSPTKSQPNTETTIVSPAPTTKQPATPTTKATTKATTKTTTKATTKSDSSVSDDSAADDSTTNDSTTTEDQSATTVTKTAKPKASPSKSAAAAAGDYTYSDDDGAPDANQPTTTVAEPPAAKSKLALTGYNTIGVVGGGLVLLLVGFVAVSMTRRRRTGAPPGSGWNN